MCGGRGCRILFCRRTGWTPHLACRLRPLQILTPHISAGRDKRPAPALPGTQIGLPARVRQSVRNRPFDGFNAKSNCQHKKMSDNDLYSCHYMRQHGEVALQTLPKAAWFKNARFRVTPGLSARTPIVPRLERVYAAIWLAWTAAALVTRKPGVPQIFQPVCVPLPRQ